MALRILFSVTRALTSHTKHHNSSMLNGVFPHCPVSLLIRLVPCVQRKLQRILQFVFYLCYQSTWLCPLVFAVFPFLLHSDMWIDFIALFLWHEYSLTLLLLPNKAKVNECECMLYHNCSAPLRRLIKTSRDTDAK